MVDEEFVAGMDQLEKEIDTAIWSAIDACGRMAELGCGPLSAIHRDLMFKQMRSVMAMVALSALVEQERKTPKEE